MDERKGRVQTTLTYEYCHRGRGGEGNQVLPTALEVSAADSLITFRTPSSLTAEKQYVSALDLSETTHLTSIYKLYPAVYCPQLTSVSSGKVDYLIYCKS